MIITIASSKGGVGKTTTAVYIAAYLHKLAPTLLLDGDETRNATEWSHQGDGFPFKVADQVEAMGIPMFKAEIPRLKAFDKAYYAGIPVYGVEDPRAKRAWQAYSAVGK